MSRRSFSLILVIIAAALGLAGCAPTSSAAIAIPTVKPTPVPSPVPPTPTVAPTNCQGCHQDVMTDWQNGKHANTQSDVAKELGAHRAGQTPDDVIHGQDAEDCIACHGPLTVAMPGLTTEADALGHFFSTIDGKFTADTAPVNTTDWPQLSCGTCHNVSANHQNDTLAFGIFKSPSAQFVPLVDSSQLCGQCHGNLQISSTDHQVYNAWTTSKHAATQADVASELAANHSGEAPTDVIQGENCIACHAPTAVLANGGMTEGQALGYFFTQAGGQFAANTAPDQTAAWPNVACTACHDPHNPGTPAYFNSATKKYVPMKDPNQLCGECHGNLRFPDTDHLSYNINAGTGGVGVPNQQMMPDVSCTDCHMYNSGVDGSNSTMFGGHTWSISVKEADGTSTTSCTQCHTNWDTAKSEETIKQLQSSFQTLDPQVADIVDKATKAMTDNTDPDLQAKLKEAQFNLSYAESDESSGFHNNSYLMALLRDAQQRAQEILTALGK